MSKKQKTLDKSTVGKVWQLIGAYKFSFILSLVFAAISVALTLYAPIITGRGIDLIVGSGKVDFAALMPLLMKLGIVTLLTAVSQWLMGVLNNRIAYGGVNDVR